MAKTVVIDYLGRSASAVKAANEVAAANERAALVSSKAAEASAAKSAAAYDAATSKVGKSFQAIGRLGGNFGVPFTGGLSLLGTKLDETSAKGKNFGSTMSALGGAELIAAGAAIGFLGLSAVHAADNFDTAHARLVTAVTDTKEQFSTAATGVSALDDSFIKLGYTTADTENSLSILTSATHNVTQAQSLMGVTADIARARNKDLGDVAVALTKAAQGNYTSLIRLGVVTKDQTKNFHDLNDVTTYLSGVFGGQASAYADTFAGKLAQLKAQSNQLEVTLGSALIPRIEQLASSVTGGVQGFESFNRATGGTAGKIALIVAAAPAAIFALEKIKAAAIGASGAEGAGSVVGGTIVGAAIGAVSGIALGNKINESFGGAKPNVDALTKSLKDFADQGTEDKNAVGVLGDNLSKLHGDISTLQGTALQKGFGFAESAHAAVKDLAAVNDAFKQLLKTAGVNEANKAFGTLVNQLEAQGVSLGRISKEFAPFLEALGQVPPAAKGASNALDQNATAASDAGFGYLDLASSVKTASDALDAISAKAFAPIRASIAVDTAGTNVQDALSALNNPNAGSSSSGSGQTATAKALDQLDNQNTLTQAKETAITASKNLTAAEKAYNDTLNGVSASSQAAKDAQIALTQAQDASKSSTFNLIDAQRSLADAKDAAANAGHSAQEGAQGASLNLQSAQLGVKDAQAALVIARESQDPETIQKAQIALGQAQLQVAQATDANTAAQKQLGEVGKKNSKENEDVKKAQVAVTEAQIAQKQATDTLTAAQRTLNDTLHGFPAASQEAQTAASNLQSAQDQVRSSTASLIRAQDTLDGKLTASSGAANAGKKLDSLTTRVDNAKTSILDFADAARKADELAGVSVGHSILAEMQTLQAYAAANPLLANAFGVALSQLESAFALNLAQIQGHPNTTGANQTSAQRKSLYGFADGGTVPGAFGAPMLAVVHGGETVIPNPRPYRGGSSSVVNININGTVIGVDQLHDEVRKGLQLWERDNGRSISSPMR